MSVLVAILSSFRLHILFHSALIPALLSSYSAWAGGECKGDDGGASLVAEIRGGDTLILRDGRAVRMAGVLIPRRGAEGDIAMKAREIAEKQIADLLLGQTVELHLDERQRDRYGRVLAQLFVSQDGERVWIQEKLVSAGLARVISFKDNRRCIPALLATEKTARDTGAGHWGSGHFSVLPANSEDALSSLVQNYEIVEGNVENVAEVRGRIYLNFGKNWRRDFTATIAGDAIKLFPEGTAALTALKGRSVRVRGWVENINGPSIAITHPEQLELGPTAVTSQR
jgi:micrococcal nuclease